MEFTKNKEAPDEYNIPTMKLNKDALDQGENILIAIAKKAASMRFFAIALLNYAFCTLHTQSSWSLHNVHLCEARLNLVVLPH